MNDPYGVTSFSEEEADELDSRLSRSYSLGPPRPHPQQDGWYGTSMQQHQSRAGRGPQRPNEYDDGMNDPYGVTSFSEEEADELDSRLSRRGGPMGDDNRSKSLMRFNEL